MTECLSVDDKIICFDVVQRDNMYLIVIGIQTGEIILRKYRDNSESKDFIKMYQHQSTCDNVKFSVSAHYIASSSQKRVRT